MNVIRKDATITNTDEDGPGSFEVVLSTSAKDRDGDELSAEDWKTPLPDHITFDTDHGMSVASTVGSGTPSIEDGKLIVRGTYSSLDRAQEVRTLVKEGHIRTTSVAFMSEKVTKDGKTKTVRELLNGAFVAIPSNREAVVLSAKAATSGQSSIQVAHDATVAAGAACGPEDSSGAEDGATGGKSFRRMIAAKAVDGSYEQREQAISDALSSRYPGDDMWAYSIATFDDSVVYRVSGSSDLRGQWQSDYTYDEGAVALAEPVRVNLVEQVVPMKSFTTKATGDQDHDAAQIAQAVDAALDQATQLLKGVDQSVLPEPVQQALGLVTAAAVSVDELLDAMGVDDPDETEETTPPAEKSADADALDLQYRALSVQLAAYTG